MNVAGKLDFEVKQGSDFLLELTYEQPDGTPISNAGMSARMKMRTLDGATVLLDFNTDNGYITLGGANGRITLYCPGSNAIMTNLPAGVRGPYDLELVNGASVTPIVEGYITVKGEATK